MRRTLQYCIFASMMMLFSACAITYPHGHLKEDESLASIKVGATTKDEALKILGSPSSESSFGPATWYYVSNIKQTRSLFAPTIIDQHVAEIAFNESGVVASVKEYSLADSKDVEIASRVTPAEGQQLGFFEQALGNLGRFNKDDKSGVTNRHGVGTNSSGYPGR